MCELIDLIFSAIFMMLLFPKVSKNRDSWSWEKHIQQEKKMLANHHSIPIEILRMKDNHISSITHLDLVLVT